MLAGDDAVAFGQALRAEDIGALAVLVFDQRDEAGAVGIVFDALDDRRLVLGAPEVDHPIGLLVAAAAEARSDAAVVVAAAGRALPFGGRLDGLAFVESRTIAH